MSEEKMEAKKEKKEGETEAERQEMTEGEFFDVIINFFEGEKKEAKRQYHLANYTEEEAKELLEIARKRDLKKLTEVWRYLFQENKQFYWYDGENKEDAILINEE